MRFLWMVINLYTTQSLKPNVKAIPAIKRTASTEALNERSQKKRRSNRYQPNSAAVVKVAAAVSHLAEAIKVDTTAPSVSFDSEPSRQAAAIKRLEEDGELSQEQMLDVIDIFTDNPRVVTSFLSIQDKNQRTQFILRKIQSTIV